METDAFGRLLRITFSRLAWENDVKNFFGKKQIKKMYIYSRVLNNNHLKRVLQCHDFCFYCFNIRNTDSVSFVAL